MVWIRYVDLHFYLQLILFSKPKVFENHPQIIEYLSECLRSFNGETLKHHLNQYAQNPALKLAFNVKDKLAVFRKHTSLISLILSNTFASAVSKVLTTARSRLKAKVCNHASEWEQWLNLELLLTCCDKWQLHGVKKKYLSAFKWP